MVGLYCYGSLSNGYWRVLCHSGFDHGRNIQKCDGAIKECLYGNLIRSVQHGWHRTAHTYRLKSQM
jgi:hypothetical protein